MKKLVFGVCTVIIVLFFLSINVCAHIMPEEVSISDYSGVISQGVKDYVKSKNNTLYKYTEAKIIFVVTDSMDGLEATEYAKKLYSSWDIANIGRGNSVFVVMSPVLSDYGAIQGKSIKRILTDEHISEMMANDFEPHFADGNFDDAVLSLYNTLGKWYEQNYNGLNLEMNDNFEIYKTGEKLADVDIKPDKTWIWVSIGAAFVIIIVFFSIKRRIDFKTRQTERRVKRKRNKADIDKIVNS